MVSRLGSVSLTIVTRTKAFALASTTFPIKHDRGKGACIKYQDWSSCTPLFHNFSNTAPVAESHLHEIDGVILQHAGISFVVSHKARD